MDTAEIVLRELEQITVTHQVRRDLDLRLYEEGWLDSLGTIELIVALSISPQTALLVGVYTIVLQMTENNLLVPRLMGRSIGVSPVVVILALLVSLATGVLSGFIPACFNAMSVTGTILAWCALEASSGTTPP